MRIKRQRVCRFTKPENTAVSEIVGMEKNKMTNENKIHLRLDETKDAEKPPRLSESQEARNRKIYVLDVTTHFVDYDEKVLHYGGGVALFESDNPLSQGEFQDAVIIAAHSTDNYSGLIRALEEDVGLRRIANVVPVRMKRELGSLTDLRDFAKEDRGARIK